MDEEAVLKTVGPKGSGVRFPLSPQQQPGELTEWYCSGPLSHHRLFGAKVRILYSPQTLPADMAYAFDCKSKEESSNLSQDSVNKIV
jgi:hypothetical protein